ncbi:MAG: nickel pincer cofactor biosynthesis protein LarC [Gemmatimonadaceae bacterium]|nr:nickel pincer cofactor biosynthesis protein LarC [Gemmatimonadaceae bacterium]
MRIAILEPFSGISGDMFLGALLDLGLEPAWLEALPAALGLEGVGVQCTRVKRGEIASWKVDFTIPPQPHGRHLKHIKAIVEASSAPAQVQARAMDAFTQLTQVEANIHGTTLERVHLHEVGAVDAILDVVGTIWGLERLGIDAVYNTTVALGDGFVDAAHGRMAVPTPATLRLLEGIAVRSGPPESGELTTPTGAVLLRVLSRGAPPAEFRPLQSGYGAGTKDPVGRANALRITIAEVDASLEQGTRESLIVLACDLDDITGEQLASAVETVRGAGALDVTVLASLMKKGRPGFRVEVLARPTEADACEEALFRETTTIGVRRYPVTRRALARAMDAVSVHGESVQRKVVTLPDGARRAKPEDDSVREAATRLGESVAAVRHAAAVAGGPGVPSAG